jgi:hypothetical protein
MFFGYSLYHVTFHRLLRESVYMIYQIKDHVKKSRLDAILERPHLNHKVNEVFSGSLERYHQLIGHMCRIG